MKKNLKWALAIALSLGIGGAEANAQWLLTGNSLGANDFIGSTNAGAFRVRTNNQERMYISSTGFVGIGTSTPIGSGKLIVSSNDIGWAGMYVNAASAGAKTFYGYSTLNSISAYHYFDPNTTAWNLAINNQEKLTVNGSGFVGIGTITPTEKLHVIGNGKFSLNVTVGGNTTTNTFNATTGTITTANATTLNSTFGNFVNLNSSNIFTATGNVVFNPYNNPLTGGPGGTFTCNVPSTFNEDASFPASLDGLEIFGYSHSSAAGVLGRAFNNGGQLFSAGLMGDDDGGAACYGIWSGGNLGVTQDIEYWGDLLDLSDAQFKTNVNTIHNSLDIVLQLKPSQYNYRTDEKFKQFGFKTEMDYGFIAQELEKVIPGLVKSKTLPVDINQPDGEKLDFKMVNYVGLIPFLTKAIQEQQTLIVEKDEKIEQLNTQVADLNDRLKKIEDAMSSNDRGNINGGNTNQSVNQLYVNNPNPFDKQTTIRYSVNPNATQASIMVMDLSGKLVSTIDLVQKGESSITISSDALAAGIYNNFLVVDGSIVGSQKMIVNK